MAMDPMTKAPVAKSKGAIYARTNNTVSYMYVTNRKKLEKQTGKKLATFPTLFFFCMKYDR
jgi:hypothetical protein